ncbi:hypothetical protein CPC08DRAFT_127151 [Agrocybe pediades]|nr:hypothetical protein CPC08DRAFT_127151 [Agrocybe pediades]
MLSQIKEYRDNQEIAAELAKAQRQAEESESRHADFTVSRSRPIAPNFNDLRERFRVDSDSPIRQSSQPNFAASNTLEDLVTHAIVPNPNDLHEDIDANSTIHDCLPDSAASHTPEDPAVHDVAPDLNALHEETHGDSPIRDSQPDSAAPITPEGLVPVPDFYDAHEKVHPDSPVRDSRPDSAASNTSEESAVHDVISPKSHESHKEIGAYSDSPASNTPEDPVAHDITRANSYELPEGVHIDSTNHTPTQHDDNTMHSPPTPPPAILVHEGLVEETQFRVPPHAPQQSGQDTTVRSTLIHTPTEEQSPINEAPLERIQGLSESLAQPVLNNITSSHPSRASPSLPASTENGNPEQVVVPLRVTKKSGQETTVGSTPIQKPMEEQSPKDKASKKCCGCCIIC